MRSHHILVLFTHGLLILPAHAQTSATTNATVGYVAGPSGRGTWSLLWGCLVTIFASTWTVLHLNVPGITDSTWTKTLRKAKWMAITVLFPEFILSKAICELRLALATSRDLDDSLHNSEATGVVPWEEEFVDCLDEADGVYKDHGTFRVQYKWKVQYSRCAWLLYRLVGLSIPNRLWSSRNPACESESSDTSENADSGPNSSHSLDIMAHNRGASAQEMRGDNRESIRRESMDRDGGPNLTTGGGEGRRHNEREAKACVEGADEDQYHIPLAHDLRTSKEPKLPIPAVWQATQRTTQRWTLTHSYYANMGGFVYASVIVTGQERELRYRVLTGPKLSQNFMWIKSNPMKGLVLSKEHILNGSKADWLSRGLAVVQITWIILNVAVRGISELPVIQLEIATVAFAIIAIATYLANWWKPKDVSRPHIIQQPYGGWLDDYGYLWPQSFTLWL